MKSIVIGSGFGGIAAALRLKAKNHNVILIEKHSDLGGRARVFKKNGFTFDAGPTVITAPYLIEELFELFNKKAKDYIKLTPLNIWYQFIFEDGNKFNYSGDEEKMKKQISKINEDDVKGYEELVRFTKKIFDKGFTELADVPFDKPLVMMKQLPALLKLKSYKSVYSLVSSYIKDEKLRRMLSMHPLLVGGNPFTTTSIYGLILYLEKKWGIHYSMGGTGNIIKGLEKLMIEEGIEIIKGQEVINIISTNNRIEGVKLDNQNEINTNNVICNADPPAVYEKLLNQTKINSLFEWKQKRMEYSMGLFVYYFGTKKTYPNVEHHTIKFGDKYKEHLNDIFDKKKLNKDISYYLHRPSATDKSMAPKGNDCFYVLVPVPNNQSNLDWKIEGEKMKNLVIDKMEEALLPNLRENIVADFYLTPDYFEKELNTKFGSGFSVQPKFTQSAYFRFHNKSEVCDGLYFVGAGTHPGAGVPGVLSSAKVLDKII
ncbi:phytoene desaturase family protein [Candidatus Pelagibacter sp.]|jgi:phytoene desaturase|nr:phytoene desaturase family protein [Candidatus Pelagibacter sp.]